MRSNYAAWQIDPHQFFEQPTLRERAAFLVRFGVLAPSSHNSQPWRFGVDDTSITVEPDLDRALPATDLANRQLYISLGCAIEAIVIAADAYGLTPEVIYEPRPGTPAEAPSQARITLRGLTLGRRPLPQPHRIWAIARRATNRSPHTARPLPAEIQTAVARETQGRVRTRLVGEGSTRDGVADLVIQGGIVAMADPAFRRELADYLLPNNSKKPVGMPGSTVGVGLFASWLVPKLLPKLNPRGKARPQEVKLMKEQTTAYVVVSTEADTPADWMDAGRSYMRLSLDAELLELTTNNLAAPVTPPEVRDRLAALVGGGFPQMCFRLGYAEKAMPHCPRLRAEEVTAAAPTELPRVAARTGSEG